MQKLVLMASRVLAEFGPLVAFYAVNHFWGLKPAIAVSMAVCAAEAAWRLGRGRKLSWLFIYSSAMTLGFGVVDLLSQSSFLYRYEASITNLMTAAFFAGSLRGGESIIQDLQEKKPGAKAVTPELNVYFRALTLVWVAYFVLKAGAYLWVGAHLDVEQAMLVRALLGSASFYALLAISIFGSKRIFPFVRDRGWLRVPAS